MSYLRSSTDSLTTARALHSRQQNQRTSILTIPQCFEKSRVLWEIVVLLSSGSIPLFIATIKEMNYQNRNQTKCMRWQDLSLQPGK